MFRQNIKDGEGAAKFLCNLVTMSQKDQVRKWVDLILALFHAFNRIIRQFGSKFWMEWSVNGRNMRWLKWNGSRNMVWRNGNNTRGIWRQTHLMFNTWFHKQRNQFPMFFDRVEFLPHYLKFQQPVPATSSEFWPSQNRFKKLLLLIKRILNKKYCVKRNCLSWRSPAINTKPFIESRCLRQCLPLYSFFFFHYYHPGGVDKLGFACRAITQSKLQNINCMRCIDGCRPLQAGL